MQIEFSEIAKQTLRDQIIFLENIWSNREIVLFLSDIRKVSDNLKKGKFNIYQRYSHNVHSALIGKKHVRDVLQERKRPSDKNSSFL
jgi:hypothetical protein